ncbi:MAG: hypothetical protein J6T96_13335 [Bacteroidales bacterium]|nr:hypothetical protein [Bacteroidales bacterium]
MKKILFKVLPIAAAIVLATSCSKDNEDSNNVINPENNTPTPEVVTPKTSSVTMSFKVNTSAGLSKIGIAEDNGNLGVSPKFDGDEVINFADENNLVTGSVTLTSANLTNDGKTAEFEVTFEGDAENIEKFKNGEITLTATIGSPLADINPTSYTSLEEAMRANSYQVSKDPVSFSESQTSITFVEQTAYLEIGLPVSKTTVKVNDNDYSLTLGRGWIALPVGTKVTSTELSLDNKEVTAAKIYTIHRNAFSVSDTKKVHFSTGNLQYNVISYQWRFAENQYDKCFVTSQTYVGSNYSELINYNEYFRDAYDGLIEDGWTELFGWGMWLEGQNPLQTTEDDSQYLSEINEEDVELTGQSVIGAYWTMLSIDEWTYIFQGRNDAANKYGVATVNEVNGLVVLPDDWNACPDGLSFNPGMAESQGKNYFGANGKNNVYSTDDWSKMEASGAIFLPVTGNLTSYGAPYCVVYQLSTGYYWTSTSRGYQKCTDEPYTIDGYPDWYLSNYFQFTSKDVHFHLNSRRHYGSAVRLVRDLEGSASTSYKFNFGGLTNDIEEEW